MQRLIGLIGHSQLVPLINRSNLEQDLFRHYVEEEIVTAVNLSDEQYLPILDNWLTHNSLTRDDLSTWLIDHNMSDNDLKLSITRKHCKRLFALQHFGPGLEEFYLTNASGEDTVIYSLLRVSDSRLARELWIRIEEGELTFLDAAARFGEGPEASRKGLIGPIKISSLEPLQLKQVIRSLSPGQVSSPQSISNWHLLVRLESLSPSVYDESMKESLLAQQVDQFIADRVTSLLAGRLVDPLHYNHE